MFYVSKIYSIKEPVDVTDSFTWETKKFSFEELKTAVASGTVIRGVSLAGKGLKVSEVTRVSEAKKLLAKYKLIGVCYSEDCFIFDEETDSVTLRYLYVNKRDAAHIQVPWFVTHLDSSFMFDNACRNTETLKSDIGVKIHTITFNSKVKCIASESSCPVFSYLLRLTSVNVEMLDISDVTSLRCMFSKCSALKTLDLSSWDTSAVRDMREIFSGCATLCDLKLPRNFVTSSCTDISSMFEGCFSLSSMDVSHWDTSSVRSMRKTFAETGIKNLDLSSFDMTNCTRVTGMFRDSVKLRKLDLSTWKLVRSDLGMTEMFSGTDVEEIHMPTFWSETLTLGNLGGMFTGCPNLRVLELYRFSIDFLRATQILYGRPKLTDLYIYDSTGIDEEARCSGFTGCLPDLRVWVRDEEGNYVRHTFKE